MAKINLDNSLPWNRRKPRALEALTEQDGEWETDGRGREKERDGKMGKAEETVIARDLACPLCFPDLHFVLCVFIGDL